MKWEYKKIIITIESDGQFHFSVNEKEYITNSLEGAKCQINELLEPKFKVGDRIRHKYAKSRIERIILSYGKIGYWTSTNGWIAYENQDDYELVPYKFDINTLKPFDKILVRLTKDGVWNATFFSHYDEKVKWGCYRFVTTSSKSYSMCIPYKDNEHLLGTSDDCDDYYKTWK